MQEVKKLIYLERRGKKMKFGDFSDLAKFYVDRPGYSLDVLNCIQAHIMQQNGVKELTIADVGAGTGKLTENLVSLKCPVHGYAVDRKSTRLNSSHIHLSRMPSSA